MSRLTAEQEAAIRCRDAVTRLTTGELEVYSDRRALLAELTAVRAENEKLKKAARYAYFAMPMCFDCWNNEKPKRFVAGRHLHFRVSGDGPPLAWPVDGTARVFAYCDKHKPTECEGGFLEFSEKNQTEAIAELEALGMPEVTG